MRVTRHGQVTPLESAEVNVVEVHIAAAIVETPNAVIAAEEVGVRVASTPFGSLFPDLQADKHKLLASAQLEGDLRNLGDTMRDPGPYPTDHVGIPDSNIPAAYTYFGQFVDHDITSERLIGDRIRSIRSPQFDLDSMYGPDSVRKEGPESDQMKIGPLGDSPLGRVAGVDDENDLPRSGSTKLAQIADMRNDENLIIAQLHVAFLRAHNRLVTERELNFNDASRTLRQHYQWIVLDDYLKRIADPDIVERTKKKNRFFTPGNDFFMPREFSLAAFRFGHSMVREGYNKFNEKHTPATLDMLFQFTGFGGFGGKKKLPEDWVIDWSRFLDVGATTFNRARRIDTTLNKMLFDIPTAHLTDVTGEAKFFTGEGRLAVRNLIRGYVRELPTGQAIAKKIRCNMLTATQIEAVAEQVSNEQLAAVRKSNFANQTPLWYYILAEAAHFRSTDNEDHLGPVGSTIVAEVLIDILRRSTDSILGPRYTRENPWIPTLPTEGKFDLADLLRFARVLR